MFFSNKWTRGEVLHNCQMIWDYASKHNMYNIWRRQHIEAAKFYDGHDVFLQADAVAIRELNLLGVTANLIAPIIDNLTGVEVQSRYKIKAEVDSTSENAADLSAGMTAFMTQIQEYSDAEKENACALRDGIIGGLGWLMVHNYQNSFFIERIHPLEIVPDFDDVTPFLTKMRYVMRMLFLTEQEMKMRWGGKVSDVNFRDFSGSVSPAVINMTSPTASLENGFSGMKCACEIQFKVPRKAFSGMSKDGRYFETFDLEKAEEIADPKAIEQVDSHEIRRAVFCQNTLLEYTRLDPSVPGQNDFSYIPYVYKKRYDNVPYGMVENLKAMQLDFNVRLTKMVRSFTAEKTFIHNAHPETLESVSRNPKKWTDPNGVHALRDGEEVRVVKSTELGDNQLKMIDGYMNLIKRTSGVEDESMGRQTNATSGVSQRIREATSLRTNAFVFDNYEHFKKRMGVMLINLIQHSFYKNIRVFIEDDYEEKMRPFFMNFTYENSKGHKKIANEINFVPFSIVVEPAPSGKTTLDAKRLSLEEVSRSPLAQYIMMSEELLRLYTDKPKKMQAEIFEAMRRLASLNQPQPQQNPGEDPGQAARASPQAQALQQTQA